MIYTELANIRFSDFTKNGVLSYEGIFRAFESVSVHHSDSLGDDMFDSTAGGKAWIISTWRIHINRLPEYKEAPTLTAVTWTWNKRPGAKSNRYYVIQDAEGNHLVEGWAVFCLLDIDTGKLVRFTQDVVDLYQPEPEEKCLFRDEPPVRLKALDSYEQTIPLPLRRVDIDYNRHVHNIEYINFACEGLTQEDFDGDVIRDIRIAYKSQVFEEDTVTLNTTRSVENGTTLYQMAVAANGEPACLLELSF